MLSLDFGPSKIWKSESLLVVRISEQGYRPYTALVMEASDNLVQQTAECCSPKARIWPEKPELVLELCRGGPAS